MKRKGISSASDIAVSFEPEDGNYYVWSEIRNHWTFLEGIFKVYASIPSGPRDNETRGAATGHLLLSYRQFVFDHDVRRRGQTPERAVQSIGERRPRRL